MKKALLTIIAATALGVCWSDESEKPLAPFMANPSAEKAYGREKALGFYRFTKDGNQYQWSEQAARTGKMGLRMILKKDMEYKHGIFSLSGLNLKTDRLYRFSLYYRTQQKKPQMRVFRISANDYYSKAPSSASNWTRETLIFPGKEKASLRLSSTGTKHGRQQMGKDASGKPKLLGRIDLTIDMDDFDLRELTKKDFEDNVVENGSFEKGETFPTGWQTSTPDAISLDDKIKYSGKKSLRIDKKDKEKGGGVQSNYMPMKSDEIYVISLWMKAKEATTEKVEICLYGGHKGKGWTDRRLWQKKINPTWEWTEYEFYLETPKEGDFRYQGEPFVCWLSISQYYPKTVNSVWIDDVRIKLMTDE